MLQTLKLLLPAIIPSWRFFDIIAPSPRIELALLQTAQEPAVLWQEFRPRPAHLSFATMLKRLFWNPRWNESLLLVSCAERLMQSPDAQCETEILNRIKADAAAAPYLQFRLVFLSRHDAEVQKDITFTSPVYPCAGAPGT